ncbi:MAG: hypothetical protein AWM53_00460 [Candidatus Dichloromethanomonas elyunquensis]|nr:MAG: hypothetical protein AWM53_00460 [Candidatus Dichloromethanomonas elyunquensis]
MFSYQKRLLFPVYVEHPDEKTAALFLEHFKGKDSELDTFARYMVFRLHVDNPVVRDLFGMIGAEELSHMEMIGVAVKKLGISELSYHNSPESWTAAKDQDEPEVYQMLQTIQISEERSKKSYLKLLGITTDTYLKKMLRFLINREEIHQRLIEKTMNLIEENGGNEQFSSLIHEYKMSLRVVK